MTRTSKDFCNPAIAPLGHSLVHRVVSSAGRKSAPAHKGFNTGVEVLELTLNRRRHLELADGNGHIAQPEPLGEYAISTFRTATEVEDGRTLG